MQKIISFFKFKFTRTNLDLNEASFHSQKKKGFIKKAKIKSKEKRNKVRSNQLKLI